MFQFIIISLFSVVTLAGTSIAWPRLSKAAPPPFLDSVRSVALQTSPGKQFASVLGVSTSGSVEPVTVSEISSNVSNQLQIEIKKRASYIVANKFVNLTVKYFDALPVSRQEEIRSAICNPVSTDTPTSIPISP